MDILAADDDPISRKLLVKKLRNWGYGVEVADDGTAAWERLQQADIKLAILDRMMPGYDGIELCRMLRQQEVSAPTYVIMLTSMGETRDVVAGLEAGANDYLAKPYDDAELHARVRVGAQMVALQHELSQRITELEQALNTVDRLEGLLPICCYCKSIRDDTDYWQSVETYFTDRTDACFSHSVCPDCHERVVKPQIAAMHKQMAATTRVAET